jgi:opacity protein-like surface antigen
MVVIAVLALGASGAQAADPGFYLTASVGQGEEDPKSNGTNVGGFLGVFHLDPVSVDVDAGDLAWGVGLGYRVNRYLAAEVEYVDFGTTEVVEHYVVPDPVPFPVPGDFDLDYSSTVTGPVLSLLGTLPVGKNVDLFVRGGALFASREFSVGNSGGGVQQKFADTVWLAGAGVDWSFAQRWTIRAEYQQTGSLGETILTGETSLKRMSVSALLRF